jgi:putative Holliday junction resolvase
MPALPKTVLALDVGERRIGVALASLEARLPAPLLTLVRSEATHEDIRKLVEEHGVKVVVVGLPRGLNGQETAQTMTVMEFKSALEQSLDVPVHWQDEALTSKQAEAELQARGRAYGKEEIDALSATYILDDFLRDHPEVSL